MSTVMDLIEGLEKTGTGERKLKALKEFSAENQNANAGEACDWMERNLKDGSPVDVAAFTKRTGIHKVTLDKARHIASGRPISELFGKPPPDHESEKNRKLAMAVAEAVGDKLNQHVEEKKGELGGMMLAKTAEAVSKNAPPREGVKR